MGYLEDENRSNFDSEHRNFNGASKTLMNDLINKNNHSLIGDQCEDEHLEPYQSKDDPLIRWDRLKWSNVLMMIALHSLFIVCYIYICFQPVHFNTIVFSALIGLFSGLGIGVGAHRLYAHRSFKAKWPLKVWLLFFQTIAMNGSAFSYARDHRVHHKFSDTKFDPANPARGLFFSHIGWWLEKKTSVMLEAGHKLDVTDMHNDPLLWFQHRFYKPLFLLLGVVLPTWIPVYFWNEKPLVAFSICVVIRITVTTHHFLTVNSLAHYFGHRPYDFRIRPANHRFTNYVSYGEGNHNYHHVFPWDYRANERSQWEMFNPMTTFIELCLIIGLAYDHRMASDKMVMNTIDRKGIKVIRDKPLSLPWRIIFAICDWTSGILVASWPIYPSVLFKFYTGRDLYI